MSEQQLLSLSLQEVANGSLGNVILEMGVYATKGELLSCFMACLLEGVVMEAPIVATIMLDPHAMFGSILLEGTFLVETVLADESSIWR